MKALRRSFLCSNLKEYLIIKKAFNFWLAFLQRDLTCSSWGLLSKWMPARFSHLLLEMAILPMLTWISCVEFVRRCDLSGFAFRRLSVNYLNKVFATFSCMIKNTIFNRVYLIQIYVRWMRSVVICVVCNIYIGEKLE